MTTYKAPIRDMQFVMQDLLNFEKHYQSLPDYAEVNQELIDAILGEASKFSEEVLNPLDAVGDEVGCKMLEDGEVRTPPDSKMLTSNTLKGAGRHWINRPVTAVRTCQCQSVCRFER